MGSRSLVLAATDAERSNALLRLERDGGPPDPCRNNLGTNRECLRNQFQGRSTPFFESDPLERVPGPSWAGNRLKRAKTKSTVFILSLTASGCRIFRASLCAQAVLYRQRYLAPFEAALLAGDAHGQGSGSVHGLDLSWAA